MISEIYKLTCPVCNKVYVGQTGIKFSIRFNEHKHAFKTNSHASKFAQHLIEHNHPFGTIHNTKQMLRHHKKDHTSTHSKDSTYTQIMATTTTKNDNQSVFPNRIFDVLLNDHS